MTVVHDQCIMIRLGDVVDRCDNPQNFVGKCFLRLKV